MSGPWPVLDLFYGVAIFSTETLWLKSESQTWEANSWIPLEPISISLEYPPDLSLQNSRRVKAVLDEKSAKVESTIKPRFHQSKLRAQADDA